MKEERGCFELTLTGLFSSIPAAIPLRDNEDKTMFGLKRKNIEIAQALVAQSETVWFGETVHDIPLQRPERLAQIVLDLAR